LVYVEQVWVVVKQTRCDLLPDHVGNGLFPAVSSSCVFNRSCICVCIYVFSCVFSCDAVVFAVVFAIATANVRLQFFGGNDTLAREKSKITE
jgi:hypothetical protein